MARTVAISLPSADTAALVAELSSAEGVVSLALQRGCSIKPPGDVLTIQATNEGLTAVFKALDRRRANEAITCVTSEPRSLICPSHRRAVDVETNEGSWEEMEALLRRETNVSSNYLLAMAMSGMVAAVGLSTDTLHIVVGAMVIAPGFEPLLRLPFSMTASRWPGFARGLKSTAAGYFALLCGAALAQLVLAALQAPVSPLAANRWVQYWSSVTPTGVLVALAASAAGATIVAAQRSVLSAGVMIALALVPGMAIAGMAVASADWGLAGRGVLRWLVDAACVVLASGLVVVLKQRLQHRRRGLG